MGLQEKKAELEKLILHYRKRGQRKGQALFNAVARIDEPLASSLAGRVFDPYYDDRRCNVFRNRVYRAWTRDA